LTVVGDDDQSIYRFRGATVDNLLEFDERFESVKTIPIETNYRSNKDIISASQSVIQNNERRLQKSISADSCDDGMVGHIHKQDATSEAAAVCDFIENSLESGRIDTPADVALLFRSVRRDAGRYTEALRQRGLPIEVTGLADIFDNEQVSAILSVADYLLGEVTEREVANLAVAKFCGDAQKEFVAGNLPSCGHAHCQKTAESLFELNSEYDGDSFVNPKEFFYEILSSFPIFEKLAGDTSTRDSTEQLRYLAGLSDVIGQIGEITEYTSLGYLRQILSLVQDQGVEPDISAYDGGIQIMTVHQAKGLEFDTVIIPSLNNGKFPNADRPDPLQIPSQLRSEPEYKSGDDHLSDERRLFYVAMTRAESRLILSSNGDSEISDFVSEIEKESIDRISPRPEIAEYDKRFSLQRQDKIESTSFTQISYYIQCPLKYGLLFDYGFERTDQPQFFYGISVHRALERFFRAIEGDLQSTESHLIEALDTEWIDRGYAGEEQEQRFRQKAESILLNFLHQHGDELNRIAYVEHPFSILENGVRVEGKMDRVDRLPSGKLRIIDFKVGETKEPGPWESFQLQLYALACERTLDEEIADCKFHYLSSDEQVSIEYNDSVQKETLSRLRSVLNKMSNREYTPSPGSYCDRCDFRGFCPAVE
jgi:DNA helicase-2/ATP-dependent DNA helicase PcrA